MLRSLKVKVKATKSSADNEAFLAAMHAKVVYPNLFISLRQWLGDVISCMYVQSSLSYCNRANIWTLESDYSDTYFTVD